MDRPLPLIVLIASYRSGESLGRTLRSLAQVVLPPNYRATWVVENGGQADARAIIDAESARTPELNLQYLYVGRANKSNALNAGMSQIGDPSFVVFTDDDVEFDPDFLTYYANAAAGLYGGVYFGGTVKVSTVGKPDPALTAMMPSSMLGYPQGEKRRSRFFLGANWAAFSSDIHQAGGFDPRFGPGSPLRATGNESTMMRSLDRWGCQSRFIPESVVRHAVNYEHITEAVILDRRQRGGAERGTRWWLQHQATRSPVARLQLQCKLAFSRRLVGLYRWRAARVVSESERIRLSCLSAYHQGIVQGWYAFQ